MKTEGPRERKGTTLNRVPMSLRLTQGDENRVSVCSTGRTREPLPTKGTGLAVPHERAAPHEGHGFTRAAQATHIDRL
jgi:hypothetical protein